ncbi:Mitochondrial dicarboxylate transporter [Sporothrix eucalyptigena]
MDRVQECPAEQLQTRPTPSTPNGSNIRYPFWFGGSASCPAAASRPSFSGTVRGIFYTRGILGFYDGLSASLLRQLTYATVRFAVYEDLKQRFLSSPSSSSTKPTLLQLGAIASVSGFLGGLAGNPADVLNVRMQHDRSLTPSQRKNYRNALDGLIRMAREEGIRSSWTRGWLPNTTRAVVQTVCQLASYDSIKHVLLDYTPMGDSLPTHLTASCLAGVIAATATNPIDVIKTRVMSSAKGQGQTGQQSMFGLVRQLYQDSGVLWMFKGWLPSFLRLGP